MAHLPLPFFVSVSTLSDSSRSQDSWFCSPSHAAASATAQSSWGFSALPAETSVLHLSAAASASPAHNDAINSDSTDSFFITMPNTLGDFTFRISPFAPRNRYIYSQASRSKFQAQNLPFQQILPTSILRLPLDCLHDHETGLDLSCFSIYF